MEQKPTGCASKPHSSIATMPASCDARNAGQPFVRIVGCGRWSMGDDQAGLVTADLLRSRYPLPRGRGSESSGPLPHSRGTDQRQPDPTTGWHGQAKRRHVQTPAVTVTHSEQPILDLTDDRIGYADLLIVIDAALADEHHPPGTFQRIHYNHGTRLRSKDAGIDTHSLGVSAALRLAESLGLLPNQVWIYVLFGAAFDRDLHMSGTVEAAIPALAELIVSDIADWMRSTPCTSSP